MKKRFISHKELIKTAVANTIKRLQPVKQKDERSKFDKLWSMVHR